MSERKLTFPGFVDVHVHFRDPGLTAKADIQTESRAAVAGGVTSYMDMPNTVPQTVTRALLEEKCNRAAECSLANYSFYIGATNDNLREVLDTDFGRVCGIKLFMGSSTGNMLVDSDSALETLFREAPCLIAAHCEDEQTIRRSTERYRAMAAAGTVVADATIHPLVRSSEACFRSSARAVELATKTGAHLHIMHISTADELSLLRSDLPLEEKKITAETCPHYLSLCDSDYKTLGFAIKCNPSIKSGKDRSELLKALKTGLIDTIGTDHAPHLREEKFTGDYFTSKSGFPSIQHSLELMAEVSRGGWITLPEMVRLMCHNPARLFRIENRGYLREGYKADITVLRPHSPWTLTPNKILSRCNWSPLEGRVFQWRVDQTYVGGRLLYNRGHIMDERTHGQAVTFLGR